MTFPADSPSRTGSTPFDMPSRAKPLHIDQPSRPRSARQTHPDHIPRTNRNDPHPFAPLRIDDLLPPIPAPMTTDKPSQTVTPDEPSQAIPTDKPALTEPTDVPTQPLPSDAPMSTTPHRVRDISSASELEAALKTVTGPVVVDFVQEGCGACSPAELEELANRCAQTPAAFFRVDVTKDTSLEKLAQDFEVEGTPTTMFAKSAKAWASGAAEEIDPASPAAARKLKCALPKKG